MPRNKSLKLLNIAPPEDQLPVSKAAGEVGRGEGEE